MARALASLEHGAAVGQHDRDGDEHAGAQVAGIVDFDANFHGADIGIEHGADIADASGDHLIGKGVEADLGSVSEADTGGIVLIDVADDPEVGEI